MNQCQGCFRFLPDQSTTCVYCRSKSIERLFGLIDNHFPDYRIHISHLPIDGRTYRIDTLLNRGGYGTILKLSDEEGRSYALKTSLEFDIHFTNHTVVRPQEVMESSKYLFSEIRIVQKKSVHQLLKIFSLGSLTLQDKSNARIIIPYILMELANTTLKELIEREADGRIFIPFSEKQKIILDMLHSLKFIHDSQMIHRDLSPNNIFVVNRGEEICYVIGDYGTSKDISSLSSQTSTSALIAKPDYFDPERFKNPNFRYDHRTDIWSAGVIITEIALGNFWYNLVSREFQTGMRSGLIDFHKFFSENHSTAKMKGEILRIIKKSTSAHPASRYSHVGLILRDLEHFFHNQTSFFNPHAAKEITIHVTQHIRLPLDLDLIDSTCRIQYSGTSNLEISQLCTISLELPTYYTIQKIRIRKTRLFQPDWEENRLWIRIRKKQFFKRYGAYLPCLESASGYLTLEFAIDIWFLL